MSIEEFITKMREIQISLLKFLDDQSQEHNEQNFQALVNLIKEKCSDPHEFKSFLYLLAKISNNHYRLNDFNSKIDQILGYFKKDITKNHSSSEIYNIFKGNKRVILFLLNEKVVFMDSSFLYKISKPSKIKELFPQFFCEEIANYPADFEEKRNKGISHSNIFMIIKSDSVEKFTEFVAEQKLKIDSKIGSSLYETNIFLSENRNQMTYIEYATFCGSIQIFNYLKSNDIKLTPSLWLYAIHSNNQEMINILKDCQVKPPKDDFKECFIEAIKCHHNEMAEFIKNTFLENFDVSSVFSQILKYYNFEYFKKELIDESVFTTLVRYGYYSFVKCLMDNVDVNILIELFVRFYSIYFQWHSKIEFK